MFNTAHILEASRMLKAKNVAAFSHVNDLETKLTLVEKERTELNVKLDGFLEHIKLSNQRRFGLSSEANILQQHLFDEIGVASSEEEQSSNQPGTITNEVTRKAKNHPKRQPFPDHLPRIETIIDIDEADKVCESRCQRVQMGQEVSEELVVIPAKIVVKQTIRPKCIFKNKVCENERIYLSLLPPRLLPKTNVSSSLVADVVTKKYVDHLPLYRQEKIWEWLKIILKRNTMCGWLMMVADKYEPLCQLLSDFVLGYDILHADETTVQVLKESGRSVHPKSYIWAYKDGLPGQQAVMFEYQQTRENKPPIKFLKTANGYIMIDAYNGYDWIDKLDNLIRLYCMAHARRPFSLGRKNWLFLGSPKGTKAACIFYSLIQAAKINNIEPHAYLTAAFERLPYCKTSFNFEELLPWNLERR